ncbi:MAG: polyketide cyclase [Anaerolineae bacterium]|nr:polyketide cyclase [Anaerolineae bacterium]
MDNQYHFITQWRVWGTVDEVMDVLADATDLPRWWPAVYLGVQRIKPGDANGIGEEISLYTKGWLPYTLRWDFRVAEIERGKRILLEAKGDFVGHGEWTFAQDGDWVVATYEWTIRAEKPLLKTLTPLLRPIFSANHRWAMAMGLQSLELELARRRARTEEERTRISAPPAPTDNMVFLVAAGAAIMIVGWLILRRD